MRPKTPRLTLSPKIASAVASQIEGWKDKTAEATLFHGGPIDSAAIVLKGTYDGTSVVIVAPKPDTKTKIEEFWFQMA